MNFARLNHVLIPETQEARDRLRKSWVGKLITPLGWLYGALSDEGRVLSVLILFVGTAGVSVDTTQVYLLWCALVGLFVGSLAVRPLYTLRARLEVRAPARVAVGEAATFEMFVHNDGPRDLHALRLRGPFLPWDGRWLDHAPAVARVPAGGQVRAEARATFVARGEHQLDVFSAALLVPGGLALGRDAASEPVRFIVVPRIAPVASIALPQAARYQPGGVAQASRIGEALELVGVRPYRMGDPVRDLHAKTWAKSGVPHVREYEQEYFSRIGIIVDNDRTAGSEEGFEAAVSLAAGIVARLARGEALIDLLVIGERVHRLTIGRSLGFFEQALDALACATRGESVDSAALIAKLDPLVGRLSGMIVVTQAVDASRRRLCDDLERRGIHCMIVRVHDDGGLFAAHAAPSDRRETLVARSAIERGERLAL